MDENCSILGYLLIQKFISRIYVRITLVVPVTVLFPGNLEDKIFEIKYSESNAVKGITSYFPLNDSEKKEISLILQNESFDEFHSIFSDNVSEDEWNRTKDQIKQKFKNELFDIDQFGNS